MTPSFCGDGRPALWEFAAGPCNGGGTCQAGSGYGEKIDAGEGVVVHCMGGIGRTGTVIGCVLRDFGFSADEVVAYLDRINRSRGLRGWPETEWQAEMVRKY